MSFAEALYRIFAFMLAKLLAKDIRLEVAIQDD